MKLKLSYIIAFLVFLSFIIYFIIGTLNARKKTNITPEQSTQQKTPLFTVITQKSILQTRSIPVQIKGLTEPSKSLEIRAETSGIVQKISLKEGYRVQKGDLLCQIELQARQALLNKSKANTKAKKIDYEAKQVLAKKGYISANTVKSAKAFYEEAIAAEKLAKIELENIYINAPFSGIFIKRYVEVGDFLNIGEACGKLIQLNPLQTKIYVTNKMLKHVHIGKKLTILFKNGQSIEGKIVNIESQASGSTGLFKVEIWSQNSDMMIKSGLTATVYLNLEIQNVHMIPISALVLNAEENIGIKHVNQESEVEFLPVQIEFQNNKTIWSGNLPKQLSIIVEGQEFVQSGMIVKTTPSRNQPDDLKKSTP